LREDQEWDEPPKTISSTYTWTIRISSPCLKRKKILSTLPISNSLLNKNPLKRPYQARGACLRPYNAFLSLYTMWETQHSQSPVVASHKLLPLKPIQEGTLHIHLVQLESFSHREG
jgi:hypothetical protein